MAWNRKDTCPYEQVADSYEFANYVFHGHVIFLIIIYSLSIAVIQQQFQFIPLLQFSVDDFHLVVLILNVVSSIIVIAAVAIKDIKKYKITPIYSLLAFLGAIFLMAGYITNIIPLLISDKAKINSMERKKTTV